MNDRRQFHKIPHSSQMISKNSWLVIFGDLLALMVTFFVLMFSMTGIDPQKWQELQESLQEELRSIPNLAVEKAGIVPEMQVGAGVGISLDYLKTVLEGKEVTDPIIGQLQIFKRQGELVVVLDVRKFLTSNLQGVREPAKRVVAEIAQTLNDVPNEVQLLGYYESAAGQTGLESMARNESLRFALLIKDMMQTAGFDNPLWIATANTNESRDLTGDFANSMLYNTPDRVEIIIKERQRNDALSQLYKR